MQSGNTIHLLQLFFVGLLAGFEMAVHYGIGNPPQSLPEEAQIVLRQYLVRRLRILAPALYLPSFLLTILVTVHAWHDPGLWLRCTAGTALLVWAFVRIIRTVPINSATLEWKPEAPPMNWRALVERAEQYHIVALWAALIAFLCVLPWTFHGR